MATDHRFDPYGDDSPVRRRSWLSTCLFGCLIIAVVGVVLAAIAAYWIAQNWRGWTASFVSEGINHSIDEADLPQQEKDEIKVQVERVADGFRNNRISNDQMRVMFQELTESPIFSTIAVYTAEAKYLDPSGLPDEEKAEARITIQRFVRGAVEGTIEQHSIDAALQHVADWKGDDGWQLRESVTDAELRAFLAVAKTEADKANVPEEPVEFDASDEIKRIIDKAMGEQLAEEPLGPEAPQAEPPAPKSPE
jgi:hypothetical protein